MPHQILMNIIHGWHCWPEFHWYYSHGNAGWIEWLCSIRTIHP